MRKGKGDAMNFSKFPSLKTAHHISGWVQARNEGIQGALANYQEPAYRTMYMQLVEKIENLRMITEMLRDHYRANLSIKFVVDADMINPGSPADSKKCYLSFSLNSRVLSRLIPAL